VQVFKEIGFWLLALLRRFGTLERLWRHSHAGAWERSKRNLFAELSEGFEALAEARQGKRTLRSVEVEAAPVVDVTPHDIRAMREHLNLSRPVLAGMLRTNPRTLENWEQGRAKPNAQAALLIRLVQRYPDTVDRLASV